MKRMGFGAVRKIDAMDKREGQLNCLYYVGGVVELGEQNPFKSLGTARVGSMYACLFS